MKVLVQGSALGATPHYVNAVRSAHAPTIRELLDGVTDTGRAIDLIGLRQYFDRSPDGERTCFQTAKILPAGFDLWVNKGKVHCRKRSVPETGGPLLPVIEAVLSDWFQEPRKIAIALSGGLDSALVVALARRVTRKPLKIVTLATRLPGYCELEVTLETAHALGVDVDVIEADGGDFVDILPHAIAACETPLFNLHPVSKLLLARVLAQRGYDAMLTGDGADQVFAGADGRNYLPIVGAMARAAGIELFSPFFDDRVVGYSKGHCVDSDKTVLRNAACTVLPRDLVWRKKRPCLAPDFDLNRFRDKAVEAKLAPKLGITPPPDDVGPYQTLWATTAILLRQMGGNC